MIKRDLKRLKEEIFDILIIGGGINGAGVARDAAIRGLKTCLIEKSDFSYGTSSKSTKLIHGGIRYLAYGHFKLVYEALKERKILYSIAPHIVKPLPFVIPVYKDSFPPKNIIHLGVTLYDLLALFHNIQKHKMLNKEETIKLLPQLKKEDLKGSILYYDCQMNDKRLCLENILDAENYGAICENYIEVYDFIKENGKIIGVKAVDKLTNERLEIKAQKIINATGVWADNVVNLSGVNKKFLRLSKGIHLIAPLLIKDYAVAAFTKKDKRYFFIIPYNNYSLIGTTDTDYNDDIENVFATKEDVDYLLDEVNHLLENSKLKKEDVIATFAGLRALVYQKGKDTGSTSREELIYKGKNNLISIFGGKYTTYRLISQKVVDNIVASLKIKTTECKTSKLKIWGATGYLPDETELLKTYEIDEKVLKNLINFYGSKVTDVLKYTKQDKILKERICAHHFHINAEILYSFEKEKVKKLTDFLSRRTEIRYSACKGLDCISKVMEISQKFLGYNKGELEEQKIEYLKEVDLENLFREIPT